jgi:mandelate racemase
MDLPKIRDIRARAVIAPIPRPLRTASGSIEAAPLILLDVHTSDGMTGRAYLFGYTPATLKPLLALVDELRPELVGQPVVPIERMAQMQARFRLLGLQGLERYSVYVSQASKLLVDLMAVRALSGRWLPALLPG